MKCQNCKASLTGTIDTFGEVGETLCAVCWVSRQDNRCRKNLSEMKVVLSNIQYDISSKESEIRGIEEELRDLRQEYEKLSEEIEKAYPVKTQEALIK